MTPRANCHPLLALKARGLCASCYSKARAHVAPKATCHPDRARVSRDGLCQLCRDRRYYSDEAPRVRRREQRRPALLNQKYGLSSEEYAAMRRSQDDRCAICRRLPGGNKPRLVVDHCHESGIVRGLLCDNCNRALGLLRDSTSVLAAALRYLSKFTAPDDIGNVGRGCDQ